MIIFYIQNSLVGHIVALPNNREILLNKLQKDVLGVDLSHYTSPDWVDISENHEMLWNLLADANGFALFGGALIIFPTQKSISPWHTIEDFAHTMAELDFLQDKPLLPFATDLFGFLYFVAADGIYHMETEDAKLEFVSSDINGFLLKLAEDGDYWSGQSLMETWMQENTPLHEGERLVAKNPFIFGGEFETGNLYPQTFDKILPWYASLNQQLKDVEDGTVIQISIPQEETPQE